MTLPFVSVGRANKTSAFMCGERESERKILKSDRARHRSVVIWRRSPFEAEQAVRGLFFGSIPWAGGNWETERVMAGWVRSYRGISAPHSPLPSPSAPTELITSLPIQSASASLNEKKIKNQQASAVEYSRYFGSSFHSYSGYIWLTMVFIVQTLVPFASVCLLKRSHRFMILCSLDRTQIPPIM